MFLEYYKLREQPFGMTPDPRFLWSSASHQEAFASLVYSIETGRGFVALIARPGMGKTTLLFRLMERLQSSARTVFLFQAQDNPREFFSNLVADLELDPTEQDLSKLQRQLNDVLIQESRLGRRFVLVVDEAQNLADSVLESVRMLSNFETPQDKLMQIILSGQPQLADKLLRPELAQLRQRVSVIANLKPLNEEEVACYVQHRLKAAGHRGGPLFSPAALAIVADRSDGVPRNINNICFHALSVGFAKGLKKIDLPVMEEVLADLNLARLKTRRTSRTTQKADIGGIRLGSRRQQRTKESRLDKMFVAQGEIRRLTATRPRTGPLTGRLFWAAALATLIIWAGVFWDSSPAKLPRDAVAQTFWEAVWKVKEIAGNIKNGVSEPPPPSRPEVVSKPEAPKPQTDHPVNQDLAQPQVADLSQSATGEPGLETPAPVPPEQISDGDFPGYADSAALSESSRTSRHARREVRSLRSSASNPSARSTPSGLAGNVVIESDVRGGRITVNGRNEPDWVTPHILSLPPGTYRIDVSKGGYSRWSQLVHVSGGMKSWVMANLGLPSGLFVLETEPPGMEVFIDGRSYGPSMVKAALSAGEHTYKVVPPSGLSPLVGTFELDAGRVLMKKVQWGGSSNLGKITDGLGEHNLNLARRRTDS